MVLLLGVSASHQLLISIPNPIANNPSWLSTFMPSPRGITFGLCLFYLSSVCSSRPFHLAPPAPGVWSFVNWSHTAANSWENVAEAQPARLLTSLSFRVSMLLSLLLSVFFPLDLLYLTLLSSLSLCLYHLLWEGWWNSKLFLTATLQLYLYFLLFSFKSNLT